MRVAVKEISQPRKGNSLASAVVELEFESHSLIIADLRILQNRSGELWVALPSFVVPEGKSHRYEPTVIASRLLLSEITNAVLAAFEKSGAR